MKNFKFLFLLFAVVAMAFSSCNKDNDEAEDAADKFVGTYTQSGDAALSITKVDATTIKMDFLGSDNDNTFNAVVSGKDFIVSPQNLYVDVKIWGNGSLDGNNLTFIITTQETGKIEGTWTEVFTKF